MDAGSYGFRLSIRPHVWRPSTDVYETEDSLVVRVEIAGMQEDSFTIELDGRYLVIRGLRQDTPEKRAYRQLEIHFGEFAVEVELPFVVDPEGVQAVYENGFLRLVLPKPRPRSIPIDS